jgi:hypothetical protein
LNVSVALVDDHNIESARACATGKRNDEEGAKEKLFTYASYVPVTSFKVRTSPSHCSSPYLTGPVPPRGSKPLLSTQSRACEEMSSEGLV